MTRLPTKRMATACWDFIVAKSTRPKPAPMLVFRSLQGTNREKSSTAYQQVILKEIPANIPDAQCTCAASINRDWNRRFYLLTGSMPSREPGARTHFRTPAP
jgi:hypothetical protein